MWLRYASVVSFVSLLLAYGATLALGWSYAEAIPQLRPDQQQLGLIYAVAVAVIAWPVWLIHWYLVQRDWLWESRYAQNYLIFFTLIGLVASVVIGVQLLGDAMQVAVGRTSWERERAFLLGACWSVGWSLAVWVYHGQAWLQHRRGRNRASESQRSEPVQTP